MSMENSSDRYSRTLDPWTLNEYCWLIHNHLAGGDIEKIALVLARNPRLLNGILNSARTSRLANSLTIKEQLDIIYKNRKLRTMGLDI